MEAKKKMMLIASCVYLLMIHLGADKQMENKKVHNSYILSETMMMIALTRMKSTLLTVLSLQVHSLH